MYCPMTFRGPLLSFTFKMSFSHKVEKLQTFQNSSFGYCREKHKIFLLSAIWAQHTEKPLGATLCISQSIGATLCISQSIVCLLQTFNHNALWFSNSHLANDCETNESNCRYMNRCSNGLGGNSSRFYTSTAFQ